MEETYSFETKDTPEYNTYKVTKGVSKEAYDEIVFNKEYLTVTLDKKLGQVIITTPKEVYQGPVELIQFNPNPVKKSSGPSSEDDFKSKLLLRILIRGLHNFRYDYSTDKYYLVDNSDNDVIEITKEEYIYIQKLIDKSVKHIIGM